MSEIIITTQAEFDALPSSFEEETQIIIRNDPRVGRIYVSIARDNSSVVTWENSSVEAYENASVRAYGNASVVAYNNASVTAYNNASVVAWGKASVRAYGNASVSASDSASVTASGSASVSAFGSASVSASDRSVTWLHSANAKIILLGFATCQVLAEGIVEQKSKNSMVIRPIPITNLTDWLANENVEEKDNAVILFKRVSHDLKTQEGTKNETLWSLGSILEHPAWSPEASECGEGKYHACSRPFFCDQFRFKHDDKYLAIKVSLPDLFLFSKAQYPHKIAFRKGEVLYEVNKMGEKLSQNH